MESNITMEFRGQRVSIIEGVLNNITVKTRELVSLAFIAFCTLSGCKASPTFLPPQVGVSMVSPHLPDHLCPRHPWLHHHPISLHWAGPGASIGSRCCHGVWGGADILWSVLWGHGKRLCGTVRRFHVCWDDGKLGPAVFVPYKEAGIIQRLKCL